MYIILVYDIKCEYEGKNILRKTFNICKKYLLHVQNSVFEGELTDGQLFKLRKELDLIIRKDCDSIIIFKCSNAKWIPKEFLGIKYDKTDNFI